MFFVLGCSLVSYILHPAITHGINAKDGVVLRPKYEISFASVAGNENRIQRTDIYISHQVTADTSATKSAAHIMPQVRTLG